MWIEKDPVNIQIQNRGGSRGEDSQRRVLDEWIGLSPMSDHLVPTKGS